MINLIALITAISISTIAAYYSIIGLTTIFAAAFWPIVIMGSFLELGKLVTTNWLYRNWEIAPKFIKAYLMVAIFILMFVTSMGIFGFLSKAHIEQTVSQGDNTDQIALIEQKIKFEQDKIEDSKMVLKQLDQSVQKLVNNDRIRGSDGAISIRNIQKQERKELTDTIETSMETISNYKLEMVGLQKTQRQMEAEIGPLKYIAELIYGSDAEKHFESSVRAVIILLVCVFDPLAIVLLLAVNVSMSHGKKFTIKQQNDIMQIVKASINNIRSK
jgi:hypothetical protein